jgi:hypothetical protein
MKNLILVVSLWLVLCGGLCSCGTKTVLVRQDVQLPPRPQEVVVTDKPDKNKPEILPVKKPVLDLTRQIACWSIKDVEQIGNALYEWATWGRAVEQIVQQHNQPEPKGKAKSWYSW